MPEQSERTFKPSVRKRQRAKDKGEIPRSQDATNAAVLAAFLLAMFLAGPGLFQGLAGGIEEMLSSAGRSLSQQNTAILLRRTLQLTIGIAIPFLLAVAGGALAINVVQAGGLSFSSQRIRFDLDRLNPVKGFQRIFSLQGVQTVVTALVKMTVIGTVAYLTLRPRIPMLADLGRKSLPAVAETAAGIFLILLLRITIAFALVGLADWAFKKWRHEKQLMMTRQEWKEDRKHTEGDPATLRRIRERQRRLALQRMFQNTEDADVVVTNPLRLAVALKYEQGEMAAPKVVAKGMNRVAEKIRTIARKHGIPVVENRPLARTLYQICNVGMEIPPKLYRPVAELLAFVFKLRERSRAREVVR